MVPVGPHGAARRQVVAQERVERQEEAFGAAAGRADEVRPLRSRSVVHSSVPDGAASTITWWNVSRVLYDSFICRVGAAVAGTPVRSTVRPMRWYDTGALQRAGVARPFDRAERVDAGCPAVGAGRLAGELRVVLGRQLVAGQ